MHRHHHHGAAAPRQPLRERAAVTQKSEDHDAGGAVVFRVQQQGTGNTGDCADAAVDAQQHAHRKAEAEAEAVARAALLGIEARLSGTDAWMLRHAAGAHIGIVHGLPALQAAVAGFEAARDDMRTLVQRMRSFR